MARVRAPELLGRGGWIGAVDTFGLSSLTGKIVVLDFFTASCINCIRLEKELEQIEQRFSTEVVVVGVHSPKFPREHEHDAVIRAVERMGTDHPVLDDPDLTTWQQYGVKGWPTLVVIDPEGYVVGGISGEGTGEVVAASISQLIAEHDGRGTLNRAPVVGSWSTRGMSSGFRTLSFPGKVAVDASGRRLAIADTGNDRVVVADLQGRVEQIYPLLTRPQGVAFDGSRIVICDTGADRVIAVDRVSGEQTVLATGLASPWDVVVLDDGRLLVAEAGRHRLWSIPPTGDPFVVAGTGEENLEDVPPLLAQPSGLAALADGSAVFVDAESSALRVLRPSGTVTTLVGQGLFDWGASDGGPDSSAMQHPLGVTVGPTGTVYVADTLNHMIRAWEGTEWAASAGRLRTLPVSGLEEPGGLASLPDGRLVIADTNNHRVVIVRDGQVDPDIVALDESWLGTAPGTALAESAGSPLTVPYQFDPGRFALDPTSGPPVRIEVSAEPATLLGPGARSWALTDAEGSISVNTGTSGEGVLVLSIEATVCDDNTGCTVLRSRTRHDITVTVTA